MLRTAELDMANSVVPSDIDVFLTDPAWAIRSTNHTVLKASPRAAFFGGNMLFDIPFLADWNKITCNEKIAHAVIGIRMGKRVQRHIITLSYLTLTTHLQRLVI